MKRHKSRKARLGRFLLRLLLGTMKLLRKKLGLAGRRAKYAAASNNQKGREQRTVRSYRGKISKTNGAGWLAQPLEVATHSSNLQRTDRNLKKRLRCIAR